MSAWLRKQQEQQTHPPLMCVNSNSIPDLYDRLGFLDMALEMFLELLKM
jgi:hypothetical protein